MKKKPINRKVVALLFATALVATGCSSSKSASPSTSGTTPGSTAETTATTGGGPETTGGATTSSYAPDPTHPIKLGMTYWNLPMIALKVERVAGVKAAIQAINAKGGIHGRPLELDVCEATDPNSGDACARKMISDGVVATIADANLIAEASSVAILNDAGIPEIDPFITSAEALKSPNVFLIAPGVPAQYLATVEFMKLVGLKTLYFLPGAIPTAQANEDPMRAAAAKYGITIAGRTEISLSAADYTPFVNEAAGAKADAYSPIIAPFQTDLLLKAMKDLGLKLRLAIGEGQFNASQYTTYGQPGGPLDGALLADVIPPISAAGDYPELQRALDDLAAYFKSTNDPDAAPDQLSTIATRSWLDVQAFAKVADAQTDITAASVMNGLNTMKDIDLGLLKWTPSTKGPAGFEKASNPLQYLSTVKDGKVVLYQKDPIDSLASVR